MDGQTLTDALSQRATFVPTRTLDITVLTGGPGSEREVSLASGRAVAEALGRRGHAVTAADISPDDVSALDRSGAEVVFIALHGLFGEDGQVQRMCERRGVPYVGSRPQASGLAMDKAASKAFFERAGLAVPRWAMPESAQSDDEVADLLKGFPPPCVVKPVDGGSSVDVTIARDAAARDAAAWDLLGRYGRALVEQFVAGREMTVGILAERALPLMEIRPARDFYDYFAKYEDDATEYLVRPKVRPGLAERLAEQALAAHKALGCRDLSRVDFVVDDDGRSYVLEVNTIPGFTSHSLVPKAAAAAGVDFDELCERLVMMALERGS